MPPRKNSSPRIAQQPGMPAFVHRHNGDGMVDSICTACAKTVASDQREMNLATEEVQHVCDGSLRKPPQKAL
jgi:hypothetical protein